MPRSIKANLNILIITLIILFVAVTNHIALSYIKKKKLSRRVGWGSVYKNRGRSQVKFSYSTMILPSTLMSWKGILQLRWVKSFYLLYYLNVHSFHSTLTAKLGPVHGVLGPTLMAKLGACCGVIVFILVFHIVPKKRKKIKLWMSHCGLFKTKLQPKRFRKTSLKHGQL